MGAVGWLLIGSIPGVLATSSFTLRVPDRTLRVGLATVLMMSGVALAKPPGETALLVVGFAIGMAAFAILYARPRWQKRVNRVAPAKQT